MSKVVKLRMFKGEEAYNKSGELVTERDDVKLIHGGKEWKNVLTNAKLFGYKSAKVLSVIEAENKTLTEARKQLDKARKIPSTPTKDIEAWESKIAKLADKPLKQEKDLEVYQDEVDSFFEKNDEKVVTTDSKEVDRLKKQNDELMKRLEALEKASKSGNDKVSETETTDKSNDSENESNDEATDEELEAERAELSEKYKALKGKAPHYKVAENIEILRKAVSELEAEKK